MLVVSYKLETSYSAIHVKSVKLSQHVMPVRPRWNQIRAIPLCRWNQIVSLGGRTSKVPIVYSTSENITALYSMLMTCRNKEQICMHV